MTYILFVIVDETEFRNFIVWLEDQKIRHYKIEDRGNLRNIHNATEWSKSFEKVLHLNIISKHVDGICFTIATHCMLID